jgi:transglutaminase-like putative cysteine protease
MRMLIAIHHVTRYIYDAPAYLGPHAIRLSPAPHGYARTKRHAIAIAPENTLHRLQDPCANTVFRVLFARPVQEMTVTNDLVADLTPFNPFDFFIEPYAAEWPFTYADDLKADLQTYLVREPVGQRFATFLASLRKDRKPLLDLLVDLNRLIADSVAYETRHEPGVHTPEEVLAKGIGSCRDSAWLLVQTLRAIGIAARFTSGYLVQLASDDPAVDLKEDHVELHAWAEAYVPGAGWIGMDTTSGLLTAEGHIPLASTPHYRTAAPISGTASLPSADFQVEMTVRRVMGMEQEMLLV